MTDIFANNLSQRSDIYILKDILRLLENHALYFPRFIGKKRMLGLESKTWI